MLHRVLSIFILLSYTSLYPAGYVELVVHGIKNIVIPAVTAAATGAGQSSFRQRSRDAFFVESMMENRGVANGTQSTLHDVYSRHYDESNRNESPLDYINYINSPQYRMEQERKQNSKKQKEVDKNNKGMTIEEIKAVNAAKNSGGGNKEPEKDPKKNPQGDPTKHRREKASDRRHDNPLPDPRKGGQSGKDLKFPTKDNPGQYIHQFDKREGHIQDLTNKARSKLWDCFEKGRFLGQDETGGFNFDYIDPETGYQLWMRTRPDGKVIDCGANKVHWGLSKHGFLEKPFDLSQELVEGVCFADTMLDNPISKAISVAVVAEEWRKDALEKVKEKELSDFLGHVSAGFKKREPTAKEIVQRAEADKFSQLEYESARKKIELARLPKPNPNAMIEITPPQPVIKVTQPSPMVLADVSPPKREKEESSGGGSVSVSRPSSGPRLSDSKISEILSNAGPRPSSSSSSIGNFKLGSIGSTPTMPFGSGSFAPGSFGKLSISKASSRDNDADDMMEEMLDDDDYDDDYGRCTGMGCL